MTSGSPQSSNCEKFPPPAWPHPQSLDTASSSPARTPALLCSPCKNLPAAAAPPLLSDKSALSCALRTPHETPGTPLPANKTRCDPRTPPPSPSRSNSHHLPPPTPPPPPP